MNSRERIAAALGHREPDRTPVFEYVLLSPMADRLLGRPMATSRWNELIQAGGWEQAVRQHAVDQLELALLLGHDMMYVLPNWGPPAPPRAEAPEAAPPAPPVPDDPVERVRARNQQNASAGPLPQECLLIYGFLREEMQKRDVDLPILAPAYVHGVWTDVDLMETMLMAPEAAAEHFALASRRALAWVEQYAAAGVDQIGVGGDFSGTRPLISPESYRRFILPEVRRVSRRVHELGLHAVNASDGNLWPVIEEFLFGCEVDGYLEIDLHAGMDMRSLKEVCRGRVTLYGNLDCGNTLSFGTPEQVAAHVTACLEAGLGGGGHILCASNAITAGVPLANYVALVNAHRSMFGLAKFSPRG